VRIVDRIFAISDTCSAANISLSEGEVLVDACELECWKLRSSSSLKRVGPLTLPATQPVPTYPVRIDDGDVYVEVEI
jgi:3-phenylpropionate/trans-cinnamate dioxygenase ferredoxin subunit